MGSFQEGFNPFNQLDVYASIFGTNIYAAVAATVNSRDHLLHAFPPCIAKVLSESLFRPPPIRSASAICRLPACVRRNRRSRLSFFPASREPTLASATAPVSASVSCYIHGKARAQPFLIGLSSRGQRGKQAELRDSSPAFLNSWS